MSDWQDKVVLITGGSAGLGLAIAQTFAKNRCRIVLAARDPNRLAAATELLEQDDAEVLSRLLRCHE